METDIGKYGSGFYGSDLDGRRMVIDMSKKIHMLSPTDTPFYVLLGQTAKETAQNPKFEWMEDEYFTLRTVKCKFGVIAATHSFSYLRFDSPNDIQALEAAPFKSTAADYMLDGSEVLVKLTLAEHTHDTAADGSGDIMWVILEKNAVNNAGTWRSVSANDYGGTLTTDATGYVIPLAWQDSSETIDNHGVTYSARTGTMATSEAICLDLESGGADEGLWSTVINAVSSTTVMDGFDKAVGSATGTEYDCYLQVYTPNFLNEDASYAAGGYYEGSGLPEETRKGVRLSSNYTQIFKTPYTITNTAISTSYIGGDELARLRARKAIQHKIDLEQALLFNGAKAIDATTSESPKRVTAGLGIGTAQAGFIKSHSAGQATANATSGTGLYCIGGKGDAYDDFYPELMAALEKIFDDSIVGSDTKMMFCSQKWLGAFTKYSGTSATAPFPNVTTMTMGDPEATFGLRVMKYMSPYGVVNVIPTPVLRGFYEDYAVILDFANISLKVLPGRDTHIVTNAQGNDEDGLKEYILTEMGLKVMHEQTHGILKLVSP